MFFLTLLRQFFLLLFFVFGFVAQYAHAQPVATSLGNEEPYHVFFHTGEKLESTESWHTVSGGQHTSLKDAAKVHARYISPQGNSLLPSGKTENMKFTIIVPRDAPEDYIRAFINEVKIQFEPQIGKHTKFEYKVSFVDTDMMLNDYTVLEKQATEVLPHVYDPVERAKIDNFIKKIQQDKKGLSDWRNVWRLPKKFFTETIVNPKYGNIARITVAAFKGTMTAGVLLSTFGLSWFSGPIIAISVGVTMWFGYYAVPFDNFIQNHKLFFSRTHTWLENYKVVRYYNMSPNYKSFMWNTGFDYLLATLTQTIAWIGKLEIKGVPAVNPFHSDFLLGFLGMSNLEKFGDSIVGTGLRMLHQKRALDWTGREYILWMLQSVDSYMNAKFKSNSFGTALKVCGGSFLVKGAIWAWGKMIPPRAREIVIVSGRIKAESDDMKYIVKRYSLDEALQLNTETEALLNNTKPVDEKGKPIKTPQDDIGLFTDLLNANHLGATEVANIQQAYYHGSPEVRGSIVKSCQSAILLTPVNP